MATVAGIALQLGHRAMLELVTTKLRFCFRMTGETEAARLLLHELGIVSAVRSVTVQTIAVSKGGMRRLSRHLRDQLLVAAQAELPFTRTFLEQAALLAAMGVVAGTALPPAEWLMRAKAARFHLG